MFLEISIRYLEIYILFTLNRINRSQVTFIWHKAYVCLVEWHGKVKSVYGSKENAKNCHYFSGTGAYALWSPALSTK